MMVLNEASTYFPHKNPQPLYINYTFHRTLMTKAYIVHIINRLRFYSYLDYMLSDLLKIIEFSPQIPWTLPYLLPEISLCSTRY